LLFSSFILFAPLAKDLNKLDSIFILYIIFITFMFYFFAV
jgi:hypothetical protein